MGKSLFSFKIVILGFIIDKAISIELNTIIQ